MSAPTEQSKLVTNKIKYLERRAAALKQKRPIEKMKVIPKTQSINQSFNADAMRFESDNYNRQLHEKAEASAAKIERTVRRNERRQERANDKAERELVSIPSSIPFRII